MSKIDFTALDKQIAEEERTQARLKRLYEASTMRLGGLKTVRDVLYHNEKGHLVYIGPRGMITGDGRL
jgi:hypothetical protein